MRVVSLRLRVLAGLVDGAVFAACLAAVIGAGVAGVALYERVWGDRSAARGDEESAQDEPGGVEDDVRSGGEDCAACGARRWPKLLHGELWGATAGLAVAGRNWRGPGFRLIGLRRVDAHTGGAVTVRSALIGVLFDQAWQAAWRPLFRSRAMRHQTRLRALAPQLRAVERSHHDDPEARSRARAEFYEANHVKPAGACGWLAVGPLVSQLALLLSSRDGRTIRDRITGTGVIADP